MKTCPTCKHQIDDSARTCPHCGKVFTNSSGVFLAVVLGVILGAMVLWFIGPW